MHRRTYIILYGWSQVYRCRFVYRLVGLYVSTKRRCLPLPSSVSSQLLPIGRIATHQSAAKRRRLYVPRRATTMGVLVRDSTLRTSKGPEEESRVLRGTRKLYIRLVITGSRYHLYTWAQNEGVINTLFLLDTPFHSYPR